MNKLAFQQDRIVNFDISKMHNLKYSNKYRADDH